MASYCITGLRAVTVVVDAIAGGRNDVGLAGGVDSLTRASMDLFREPSTGLTMGEHMELTCKEWDIPCERQDEVALASAAAWERGWWGAPTGPVDWGRVNVNGSSIAVGHPWAATGTRILTTLANEMKRRDARYGLVSICAAGAMAGAFLLSR